MSNKRRFFYLEQPYSTDHPCVVFVANNMFTEYRCCSHCRGVLDWKHCDTVDVDLFGTDLCDIMWGNSESFLASPKVLAEISRAHLLGYQERHIYFRGMPEEWDKSAERTFSSQLKDWRYIAVTGDAGWASYTQDPSDTCCEICGNPKTSDSLIRWDELGILEQEVEGLDFATLRIGTGARLIYSDRVLDALQKAGVNNFHATEIEVD